MNQENPKKIQIPRKILYVILLMIFSSSSVGLVADLDSLFIVEFSMLMLILGGGSTLIHLSFHRQRPRIR
ncbi:MAG: hypothetical protein VKL41_09400 [Snowella sp.]|nr:hypothetical protein [Snowella sp.]